MWILFSYFIGDTAVFFGAFLGPIFPILIFNTVIFVIIVYVIIKHTISNAHREDDKKINPKTGLRLLISITGVMFLFGLTWLFGALTVTGATLAFQVLFVFSNAFQGFFIFLFFCVFSRDARELWKETLSCRRYQSKVLHPSKQKYTTSGSPHVQTKKTNISTVATTSYVSSTFGKSEVSEDAGNTYVEMDEKENLDEKPRHSVGDPTMTTFTGSTPPATEVKEIPLTSEFKKAEAEQESKDRHSLGDPTTDTFGASLAPDDPSLKARVKRFSTKKEYKHHVEQVEVDFSDSEEATNTNQALSNVWGADHPTMKWNKLKLLYIRHIHVVKAVYFAYSLALINIDIAFYSTSIHECPCALIMPQY